MPIIYTYPTKATPVDADLVLISDSASTDPSNQTKQVTMSSIRTFVGTTSYTAGDGLDLTGNTFSTDLKANGGLVIEATELAVDLGASSITGTLAAADGGTGLTSIASLQNASVNYASDGTNALPVDHGGTGNTATALYSVFVGTGATAVSPSTSVSTGIRVPKGSNAQQPAAASGINGLIRYNTTSNQLEVVINGAWRDITTTAP
jgi:hypothetical protein